MSNDSGVVVRKHNKPRPRVAHRAVNARFLGIDRKCNTVVTAHL